MFLEACLGFIAISLPTLSAVLQMDILSRFIQSVSSLFSLRQRSRDTEVPWVDGDETMFTKASVSTRACQNSEVENSLQSFELKNTKGIKVVDNIEQTRSMV